MPKLKPFLFILSLSLIQFHCATSPAGRLPKVKASDLEFQGDIKTKIFSSWTAEIDTSFNKENIEANHVSERKKAFEDVVKQTGCCVLVDRKEDANLILNMKTYGATNLGVLFLGILSSVTVYLIPSWITLDARIEAQVQGRNLRRMYQLSDSVVLTQWLPLIVAEPSQDHLPLRAQDILLENVFKTLLLKMKEDGFLAPKQDKGPPTS
ncbi:MAG TPA: hypothetical protein VE954_23480 [Oligoflexus sp.]|uniref:hypothetical protein n=1 Tax=Oligoflexus sp. TaxID=1971216 RepID=UPI002D594057|nr:hypothetical protein [Oligoflexus sp.]HYX36075.1 hypothetical protein [Oligoflexus sp.]